MVRGRSGRPVFLLPLRGPQPLSAQEAVAIAERVTGLRFRVRRAPLLLLKLVRAAAGPFHSHFDALLGLMIGQEASSPDLPPPPYEAFGIAPTTFEQYVRRCVAA